MKCSAQRIGISLLGLALVAPLAGCQEDNETGLMKPGEKGTADPKYADDSSYEQYFKDQQQKKAAAGKGASGKTAPAKAAPAKAETKS